MATLVADVNSYNGDENPRYGVKVDRQTTVNVDDVFRFYAGAPSMLVAIIYGPNKDIVGRYVAPAGNGAHEITLDGLTGPISTTIDDLCVIACADGGTIEHVTHGLPATKLIQRGKGTADNNGKFRVADPQVEQAAPPAPAPMP